MMNSCYKKSVQFILTALSMLVLVLLTGCAGMDFDKLKINLNTENAQTEESVMTEESQSESAEPADTKSMQTDPERMIEYLRNRKLSVEDSEKEESFEWDMTKEVVFLSNRGYDSAVVPKGMRFVNGTYEIIRVSDEDVPSECKIAYSNLIRDRLDEIMSGIKDFETSDTVKYLADMLLCLEYYSDSPAADAIEDSCVSLAEKVLADYSNKKVFEGLSDAEKYDVSAVLAGCVNLLSDNEVLEKDGIIAAEDIWNMLEDEKSSETAAKFWAAASLYSSTGDSKYCEECEDIVKSGVPTGFDMKSPGYYGCFTYMHSNYKTDNNINAKIMECVFADANELIKHSLSEMTDAVKVNDFSEDTQMSLCIEDMKEIDGMIDDSRLAMMTNYISTSVEYIGFAQDRLNYIYGVNHTGCDYTNRDTFDNEVADIFTLCSLLQNSIK